MAGLFFLTKKAQNAKQAAKIGFIFALTQFAIGLSWIHVSIDSFGGLPLFASIAIMLALCAYLAFYPALVNWLWFKFCKKSPAWLGTLLYPSIWLLGEYLRGTLLTGFPWLSIGYSQTNSILFNWASIIGVQGIGWICVFLAACLAQLKTWKQGWQIGSIILLGAATLWVGTLQIIELKTQSAKVALVQGNIPQTLKWEPEHHLATKMLYQDLSRPHYSHDLLIWPEAAIPAIEVTEAEYLSNLDKALAWRKTALVTGIVDYQPDTNEFYNNLIVLGRKEAQGETGHYQYRHSNRFSKHHLLPIGEFVPLSSILRPLAPLFNLPMSSFSRGEFVQPNLIANGYRLAPAMCYEILFSEQVRQNVTTETDFVLTVSNDSWFGDSTGPHQHMEIAQMRAKELGRAVIRATNSGVTGVIDANGKIIAQLPQFKEGVLSASVPQYSGVTAYHKYGNTPIAALCLLSLLALLGWKLHSQKQNNPKNNPANLATRSD